MSIFRGALRDGGATQVQYTFRNPRAPLSRARILVLCSSVAATLKCPLWRKVEMSLQAARRTSIFSILDLGTETVSLPLDHHLPALVEEIGTVIGRLGCVLNRMGQSAFSNVTGVAGL